MTIFHDNRRCKWCRRLCRYFGEDRVSHLCTRCQMWCHRNRYCQIKHALCSNSSMTPALRHPRLWGQMLNLLCGSIRELDLHVQQYIWQTILCGPAVNGLYEGQRLFDYWMYINQAEDPWECSKLWQFWMLDIPDLARSQNLVPRYNDHFRYTRVLFIVIAFLGPFSEFGVAHGPSWTRGWIFHAVPRKGKLAQGKACARESLRKESLRNFKERS